ncbi:hypothetical protein [Caballeronia sp. BCC1704]|uniref:hypothetical protein n=1 Tax=Caballeronia sp. BCC1704 TaxID=2676300 RepID=UPI00158A0478|nr:hypothetical protein [Caballeronia sp. BCC1704]
MAWNKGTRPPELSFTASEELIFKSRLLAKKRKQTLSKLLRGLLTAEINREEESELGRISSWQEVKGPLDGEA